MYVHAMTTAAISIRNTFHTVSCPIYINTRIGKFRSRYAKNNHLTSPTGARSIFSQCFINLKSWGLSRFTDSGPGQVRTEAAWVKI